MFDTESDRDDEGFWLEASAEEMAQRLDFASPSAESARLALRNPYVTEELVRRLLDIPDLRSNYQWKRDLASHSLVSLATAMSLVSSLFWRDLAKLSLNVRVRPQLRRQAEQLLLQRLPRLALGEKVALARIASQTLVSELRKDTNTRVFSSLLENPRLTEGDLMPFAVGGGQPETIRVLLADRRWGARIGLRRALVRNPRTPIRMAVNLVESLPKTDQRALARDNRVREPIRRRGRVLLGEPR